ncbi:methyltransferase domain-containing protein [Rubrobacter tropicus]|uniref:Methyltransferase domain-containing protein n=1 Tax=Rubrobacter tropicus TaxID=2653851 RepID=A0A6G8Q9V2_9ACTN|nr:class I SAM-dependent methyltransferase [Rubrobacter tropicus]QIN83087.1 methyltransferase domain-containing protein [Rubrobacter tropicus]
MNARTNGGPYDFPLGEADGGVGAFVRSRLPAPPARVLEVGCGDGRLALALAEEGWRMTAVDPAAPGGGPFIRGAVEDLDPSEHGPFDAAVAVLSLHHLHDLGAALGKVRSLLAPGAVFIVDEFGKEELEDGATAAYAFYQRLALLHGGYKPVKPGAWAVYEGDSFEGWRSRISSHWEHIDEGRTVLSALEASFERREFASGPFLFRDGLGPELEPLERMLIGGGGIRPVGFRWVGAA